MQLISKRFKNEDNKIKVYNLKKKCNFKVDLDVEVFLCLLYGQESQSKSDHQNTEQIRSHTGILKGSTMVNKEVVPICLTGTYLMNIISKMHR